MKNKFITKSELASEILPDIEQKSAVNRMMIWVNNCPGLVDALMKTGYNSRQKYFTPQQQALIREYLVA